MNTQPVLNLSKKQKLMVSVGSVLLMVALQMYGLSINTSQVPVLEQMNALEYLSLVSTVYPF